jgi:hypothetical protein
MGDDIPYVVAVLLFQPDPQRIVDNPDSHAHCEITAGPFEHRTAWSRAPRTTWWSSPDTRAKLAASSM